MKILVTGATGYIGGRLVPELLRRGHAVRVFARDPRKLDAAAWRPEVEVAAGDVARPETLPSALAGIDVAYYLVHSMGGHGVDFARRDREAAAAFGRAAAAAGVRRIVYLGGLGAPDAALSEHLRSRQETGAALREGGVPVTELRAAIIVGSGSASFEIIRDLARKLPVMICPRWVNSRCEPIAIRQVLGYLTGVLDEPRTIGGTFEIGGGDVLTYADLMRVCAEVMGRRVRILVVPVLTPALSAYWLNLVTTVPMSVARPLVEGLRNDVVTTDRRLAEWIPVERMSYREAVARALKRAAEPGRLESRWTSAQTRPVRLPNPQAELFDRREVRSEKAPERVFAAVGRIGGDQGWYYADWIWRLRGVLDRLCAGPGMRRGRNHPTDIAVGDPIDFWRVQEYVPGRLLKLRAEMKVPGAATLTFEVVPEGSGSRLVQLAEFTPYGFLGRLYWQVLIPVHAVIFGRMARAIVDAA
jgi:uncharacterized protein YbjT (DUF2867 family)